MINQSDTSSKYLITEPGFAYDILRGLMLRGSTVSKACHQLSDVESLKSALIVSGSVAERGDHYECVRDIPTGLLMAYNLHNDSLVQELPEQDVPFTPESDEMISINEALRLWSMYSPDPDFVRRIELDCFRIIKFIRADYDWTFVNGKGDGSLSKVEQFVIDALKAAGEIDEYRRGDPAFRECDIVVEEGSRQIEFVSLFDEKVPPRVRYRSEPNEEQSLLMEYYDFGYNIVAAGVVNKFTLKNYTDKYSKELAIYMLGPSSEAADKVDALKSMLYARIDQIRNYYTRIHIIVHDPLDNESFAYCSNDKYETFPDSLCSVNIVQRHPANVDEIDPDKNYLMIKQNIFSPEVRSMYWSKGDIIKRMIK